MRQRRPISPNEHDRNEAFSGLPEWLDGFTRRELPNGYLLSFPGNQEDFVFFVLSGRLKIFLAGENRELSLGFLGPNDLYATHTPTYVRCVTTVSLWHMETAVFLRKMTSDPRFTPMIMPVLGRILGNAISLVEDLAFREVPARLARFFVGLTQRRGYATAEGWVVSIDLGTQDIAELLGTTRQTVSSLINQWERTGILRRSGRRNFCIQALDHLKELSAHLT